MTTTRPVGGVCLWILIGYCCVSMLTLPFLDSLWLGELPVLALVQLPKTVPAVWARREIAMPAIRALGLSKGSFSPDYALARPYGLLLVYLVPAAALVGYALASREARRTRPRQLILAVALLGADFALTLALTGGPGLTTY